MIPINRSAGYNISTGYQQVPLTARGRFTLQIARRATNDTCEAAKLAVTCSYGKEEVNGECRTACGSKAVRAEQGACTVPAIEASVQSNTLEVKLNKPNPTLNSSFGPFNASIGVASKDGKYPITWVPQLHAVHGGLAWVSTGDIENRSTESHRLPLVFTTTRNLSDGTNVEARLDITGSSSGIPAAPDTVAILASVWATPSLQRSTIDMPTEVMEGQEARVKIQAYADKNKAHF